MPGPNQVKWEMAHTTVSSPSPPNQPHPLPKTPHPPLLARLLPSEPVEAVFGRVKSQQVIKDSPPSSELSDVSLATIKVAEKAKIKKAKEGAKVTARRVDPYRYYRFFEKEEG
ncbi:hypothetical protein H4Q26_018380 [Puccinia striiformis f. sp. tritici PST-130]|nr:hypothetical protein H4Q26_018380 [Puccinia striiformis f. sp. tritici PST-130]